MEKLGILHLTFYSIQWRSLETQIFPSFLYKKCTGQERRTCVLMQGLRGLFIPALGTLGFRTFRKGWPGHLPATRNYLFYWEFFKDSTIFHKKWQTAGAMAFTMDWPLCVGRLKLTGLESRDLNTPFLLRRFPLQGKKIPTGQSCYSGSLQL